MISTKHIIVSVKDIPNGWLFEHILNLPQKLSGEEVAITSPFRPKERVPSFTLFQHGGTYFFKDFGSGLSGNAVQLAQALFPEIPKADLYKKLCAEYLAYMSTGKHETQEYKTFHKYKLHDFLLRSWNTSDSRYWTQYHIGSKILERYNIAPLQQYTLKKELQDGTHKTIHIEQPLIYGYFDKTGAPYKLYQPHSKTCKFFKVKTYIQGDDQREGKENLLITKSLKDICGFTTLGVDAWEAVSPDSENALLPEKYIVEQRKKYTSIITLFDNDAAGDIARENYKVKYNLPTITLNLGHKDLTDHMKAIGVEKTKKELIKLLK